MYKTALSLLLAIYACIILSMLAIAFYSIVALEDLSFSIKLLIGIGSGGVLSSTTYLISLLLKRKSK